MNQLDRIEVKLDLILAQLGVKNPKSGETVPVVVPYSAGDPAPEEPKP